MKLAVIFNGQGAHYEGMGMDFDAHYETATNVYNQFEEQLQKPVRQWIIGDSSKLKETRYAQVAIVATSIAIYNSIQTELPAIHYMAGLSLGEYSALIASKMLSLEQGIQLLEQRGELMSAHCALLAEESPAEMVAVMGVSQESLQSLIDEKGLAGKVCIANINSTQQLILAGRSEDIASFKLIAKEHGIKKLLPLKVEGPFHSPLMEAVCNPFGKVLDGIAIEEGQVPVISNTTLEPHQSATVKDVLVRHLVEPVQWRQTIDYLVNGGITHIVQIGPGNTLAQLLKREENAPQCIVVDKVADVELLKQFIKGENK